MKVEVICGPMFSGKTEELIRRITRAKYAKLRVLSFKPSIDSRYSKTSIASHSGAREACFAVNQVEDILDIINQRGQGFPDIVAIEEAQFFEQEGFKNVLCYLRKQHTKTIIAGLDMDFAGVPFENIIYAMGIANRVDKLSAVCVECGADATMTYRKSDSNERVEIGETDIYEARCYGCWQRKKPLKKAM